MKELIITPQLANEAALKGKPAILSISKMNMAFNQAANARLALREGVFFQLQIRDGKLFYKEVFPKNHDESKPENQGFQIKKVGEKFTSVISPGTYVICQENIKKTGKTMRFEIQDIKDGLRELKFTEA